MSLAKTNAAGHIIVATTTDTDAIVYSPDDATAWTDPDPTTLTDAIDTLAQRVRSYTSGSVSVAASGTTTVAHGDYSAAPQVTVSVAGSSAPTKAIILHGDGSDGSTTITDTGSNGPAHAWSCIGNAQLDTAQAKFGASSFLLDGNGDCLRMNAHADMSFTGDFTISFWIRPSVVNGIHVLMVPSDTSNNFQLAFYSDGRIDFYQGTTQVCTSSAGAITASSWQYVALTRTGSTCKIWVGGTEVASGTRSGTIGRSDSNFNFGMYADGSYPFAGHYDEIMSDNGTCLYTGSFTPPTGAWSDSTVINNILTPGTDYTAYFMSTGTSVTRVGGATTWRVDVRVFGV